MKKVCTTPIINIDERKLFGSYTGIDSNCQSTLFLKRNQQDENKFTMSRSINHIVLFVIKICLHNLRMILFAFFLFFSAGVFAQTTVTVSGGATTATGANGTYNYAGTTTVSGTERKYFDHTTSSTYRIEYRYNSTYSLYEWEVWESTARGGSGTVRFYNSSSATIIPSGTWQVDVGSGSPVISYTLNEAPVLASIEGTNLSYTENAAATAITSLITVSDADDTNIESATVQITGNYQNGQDVLSFTNQNGISGTWTAATGTMSLSGSSTKSNYQTALRSVQYNNTSNDPNTSTRTVSFTVNDGDANSNTQTRNIAVTSVNDEPTLTATGTNPTFTEGGSASDLYSSITISTIESGQTITQLVLTVTNVSDGSSEILRIDGSDVSLTNGNSVTTATNSMSASVSVSGGTATVTLSKAGGISSASMQTLIDGITYRNTSDAPNTTSRVVTLTSMKDNGGTTNSGDDTATLSVASTVTVAAVNDAPTLTSFAGVVETTTQNTEDEITLAELKAQGNEADVDGTVDAFIVNAVSTGTLKIGTNAGAATAYNSSTNKTINASNNAYWTPATDVYGTLNAFTATVQDNNGAESTGAVQATVQVNDYTVPSVSSITISGTPAVTATSITFVVTFSESVKYIINR